MSARAELPKEGDRIIVLRATEKGTDSTERGVVNGLSSSHEFNMNGSRLTIEHLYPNDPYLDAEKDGSFLYPDRPRRHIYCHEKDLAEATESLRISMIEGCTFAAFDLAAKLNAVRRIKKLYTKMKKEG